MPRIVLGTFVAAVFGLGLPATEVRAGETALAKELEQLNDLTGSKALLVMVETLVENKEHATKLLAFGLPAAKDKQLSYNGALVLGLVAAELKDMKTAEAYLRVCMDRAAKLQSPARLEQSYGLLIGRYYNSKQYASAARICRELLELNTDDGKTRIVIATKTDRFDNIEFAEREEGFDPAQSLRTGTFEIYVKATAKQGHFDQALKLVENRLKKNADWFDSRLKCWVLVEAGKLEDAAQGYEDIIAQIAKDVRLEQQDKDLYLERFRYEASGVYVELKKIDRASAHLQYLIDKHPDNPAYHNDLGFIWADHDLKLEEAEKLIRKALELDRALRKKSPNFNAKTDHDNGAYLDSLSWVLHKQQKHAEAKTWQLKALEDKTAQHIELYDHLADIHMALGERELAIKAWQKGLEHVNDTRRDRERKAAVEMKLEKAKNSKVKGDPDMVQRMALLVAFLLTGLSAPAVHAQEGTGRPFVVAIGIDNYQDAQIKPRLHAEADATALVNLFLAKERLGVEPDHVKLLLGSGPVEGIPSEKATKDNIVKALQWLGKSAAKDDLVILAIFGNGAPVGERTCYFAVDSTYKNRTKDAIASDDLEVLLDKVQSQRFVAMVDVHCYGFDPGKEKKPDLTTTSIFRVFLSQGEDTESPAPSRVLFIAGAAAKPSLDLDQHGVFAQALLDGLSGKADASGYEPDGNITVGELAKYVRRQVSELVRTHGKIEEQKKQQAAVVEAQTTDFVIAHNPAARAKALQRQKQLDALVKEKQLDQKIADEGRLLLARMPKLEALQQLRKAYQQLVDDKIDVAGFNAERARIADERILSDPEARKYAGTVLRAADLVRKSYYKEVAKAPLIGHAIIGLYKRVEEKVPPQVQEGIDKVKDMKDAELLALLSDARRQLGKRGEDLDSGKDITYSLDALLGKLDRHTGYVPPEVVQKFRDDTAGSFRGIGVQIRRNEALDQLQVVTPIYNSPAHKAGLRANDIITTIISEVDPKTGKPYDEPIVTPTKGMTTEDAVKKIKGKVGTRITVLIQREGSAKPLEFNLIRASIEVESVLGHKRNAQDAWDYVIDPEHKICYVRLTQFSENTYHELEKVMRQLSKEGIKGFILDLRFNPGGLLDSSIKIADLFIDDGLIVSVRHRDGTETSYVGRQDGSYTTFPMVCLINGGSAGASEIVSGCLQDHGRAIVMGSRSYGKGSVQTIHPFDGNSVVKLTSATFWRPSGQNLNKSSTGGKEEDEWGVSPNKGYALKLSKKEDGDLFEHLRAAEIIGGSPPTDGSEAAPSDFRDRQLDQALEYLRNQIRQTSCKDAKRAASVR